MDSNPMLLIESNASRFTLSEQHNAGHHESARLRQYEIRLIRLLPRSAGNRIQCETTVVSLKDEPTYLALSYTWGAPPDSHVIEINGREVFIRENLWAFLEQASRNGLESLVWIDAICIDQTNADERAQQIGLMEYIFTDASTVIVWLGSADSSSDLAVQALADCAQYIHYGFELSGFWDDPRAVAVIRLCERAYWTRLWVFQELMLATKVTMWCGGQTVDLVTLRALIAATMQQAELQDIQSPNAHSLLRTPAVTIMQRYSRPIDNSLWELIMATRDLGCSVLRDKVYGLLGLVRMDPEKPIKADYTTSLYRLLNAVLKIHFQEQPPTSIESATNDCNQLLEVFGLDSARLSDMEDDRDVVPLPTLHDPKDCPFGEPDEPA
ncbi:hypothetical protein LTR27_005554 [Elasticomyces elasticus]|nr:hypothetical protein LTR27_005554 [Elasticomyces elasticus]